MVKDKLNMKNKKEVKINKLDINLFGSFEGKTIQERYDEERLNFISRSERYIKGYPTGLFGWRDGYYEKTPEIGKIEWEKKYPKGIEDWERNATKLNAWGEQQVINKINELVEIVNKKLK